MKRILKGGEMALGSREEFIPVDKLGRKIWITKMIGNESIVFGEINQDGNLYLDQCATIYSRENMIINPFYEENNDSLFLKATEIFNL